MATLIIFIVFIAIIYSYISKGTNLTIKNLFSTYMNYLSNVKLFYSDANILLYRADKSGENFVFAIKNTSYPFTITDVFTLYDKAEKLHIHNKILITDYPVDASSAIYKKVREYKITVWNSNKLKSLVENEFNDSFESSTSSKTSSPLSTSNTSDDNCEIEEANDPIQDGSFNTHGIFSFLGNKPDRL